MERKYEKKGGGRKMWKEEEKKKRKQCPLHILRSQNTLIQV
jgi:hypothetical protein